MYNTFLLPRVQSEGYNSYMFLYTNGCHCYTRNCYTQVKKKNTFQENEYYESDRTRYESGKRYIVYILPIPEKMINNK